MATPRRFGSESSKSRTALLEAAETLMREDGYAGVTARRIAIKADLKFQLVHYYFRTIDELFLALLRNIAERNQKRFDRALTSAQPLRMMWAIMRDPHNQVLASEFKALANHRKTIQTDIAIYDERSRTMQIQLLAQALERHKAELDVFSPVVLAVLMASAAQYLTADSSIGASIGHSETVGLIERYLQKFEPSGNLSTVTRPRAVVLDID